MLKKALKEIFGYEAFRTETQKNACVEIAKRKHDVYVSMPTGECFSSSLVTSQLIWRYTELRNFDKIY